MLRSPAVAALVRGTRGGRAPAGRSAESCHGLGPWPGRGPGRAQLHRRRDRHRAPWTTRRSLAPAARRSQCRDCRPEPPRGRGRATVGVGEARSPRIRFRDAPTSTGTRARAACRPAQQVQLCAAVFANPSPGSAEDPTGARSTPASTAASTRATSSARTSPSTSSVPREPHPPRRLRVHEDPRHPGRAIAGSARPQLGPGLQGPRRRRRAWCRSRWDAVGGRGRAPPAYCAAPRAVAPVGATVVDSPPTSTRSAPAACSDLWSTACSEVEERPPSEKESGAHVYRRPAPRTARCRSNCCWDGGGFILLGPLSLLAPPRGRGLEQPRTADVVVREAGLADPAYRHSRCSASMTTITPCGIPCAPARRANLRRDPLLDLRAPGVEVAPAGRSCSAR